MAQSQGSGQGAGPQHGDISRITDALAASADQELQLAERISVKARQAYALAAGVFVVSQTVAFNSYKAGSVSSCEQGLIIGLAIVSAVLLGVSTWAVLRADNLVTSGDLPLDKIENDLNDAHGGNDETVVRLSMYYLGVIRTRRDANDTRRDAYRLCRLFVSLSLLATVIELIVALIARAS